MDPVTDRQKSVVQVLGVHRRFARSVARALRKRLRPYLEPGTSMPDWLTVQRLLAAALDDDWHRLSAADDACDEAQTHRRGLIDEREGEVALLYREVVDLRSVLRGRFGPARSRNFIGLRGDTSRDPVVLLRQADRAVARLRDRDRPAPPSRPGVGDAVRRRWAAPVADAARVLHGIVDRVTDAVKRLDAAQLVRKRALEGFNAGFVEIAGLFESLYRAAGRPDLAEAVKPSGQHLGLTHEQGKQRFSGRNRKPARKARIVPFPRLEPVLRFFGSRRETS